MVHDSFRGTVPERKTTFRTSKVQERTRIPLKKGLEGKRNKQTRTRADGSEDEVISEAV